MGTVRITSSQVKPSTTFYLEADIVVTDTVNRRWRLRFYLRAKNGPGGSTDSRYDGSGVQIGRWNGVEFGRHSGTPFLPGGYQDNAQRWNNGPWYAWIPANTEGYWRRADTVMPLQMQLSYGNINTTATGSITIPRIGTVPAAPTPVPGTPDQITATTMRYQVRAGSNGGSAITRLEYQYSTSPTFASGNSTIRTMPTNGVVQITGLTPATPYYQRARAVNALGNSVWSAITSGTTVAGTAPGMLVLPSLDGASATVTLTPPASVPAPSGYRVEYRLGATGAITGIDTAAASINVAPLTPGATYQWRAAAKSGTYTGPFTAWTSVVQPYTNTNPGDYFDGSTASRADLTFAWTGAVNNSTSRANGRSVLGWGAFSTGSSESGGTGALYRVTGGRSQQFAARVDFWTPTTAAGFHAGTGYGATEAFTAYQGANYDALIHVRIPSRSQSLAAMLVWLNSSGAEVARSVGTPTNVSGSGTAWTPLRVSGSPPASAVRGAIRVIDVAGPGWSLWNAGDTFLIDDAITPFSQYYFDGNTPDTAQYIYSWLGPQNASRSQRLTSLEPAVDPLVDPDCPPVPAPPRPPMIDDSCVEDNLTEWRRVWQEIPATIMATWVDAVPILKIETTTDVRLVRVRYYPNPFGRDLSQLELGASCSEQTISFIPQGAVFTLDGVSQRAFAEMAGSASTLSADHLLRGDANLWPVLGCGIGYYVTVDVPIDTPANALSLSYSLVQRYS